MLTDSPPDAPLMALADQGKLRDPATLAAEARRLLGAAPARQIVGSFFAQWLQFDGLPALTKDASLFPMYTPEVVKDARPCHQTSSGTTGNYRFDQHRISARCWRWFGSLLDGIY
jgi:hypothetical protein